MRVTSAIIDFHSHILPQLDDGSNSVATSLEMMRRAAQDGTNVMVATPHYYGARQPLAEFLEKRHHAWQRLSPHLTPDLPQVRIGAEVAFHSGIEEQECLEKLCIQGTDLLLLEMPFSAWTSYELDVLSALALDRGLRIILAHFERFYALQHDPELLTRIWERWDTERRLEEERYRELQKLHLQVMYQARWFPYASTLAGDMLFDEINEIIASSKIGATVSKRCEKRIDTAILSHYTKAEIKRIKKKWNDSEIEPYFKKALGQTLDAYLRKEYALAIPFLATMWEGIIKSKVGKNEKKFKEKCKDLVDENGYDEVFSDFFNNLIFGQCYSVNDVVDGIPNRNGVAHSWYIKYPSQKAALNAILLTDFVLSLKPKNEAEDIEKE